MRWVERLWRDDGRVKATPAGVAASLAGGVTRSTNLLRVRLEEQGVSRADRKRFESEACILECLLFEWFLRDIVVALEFGRHTDTIQRPWPSASRRTLTEAVSLRRFCWISSGFVASGSRVSGGGRGQHLPAGVGGAGLVPHRRHGRIERPDDDVPGDARDRGAASAPRFREEVHPHHRAPLPLLGTPRGIMRRQDWFDLIWRPFPRWTDPARSDTDECLLECTILEWAGCRGVGRVCPERQLVPPAPGRAGLAADLGRRQAEREDDDALRDSGPHRPRESRHFE